MRRSCFKFVGRWPATPCENYVYCKKPGLPGKDGWRRSRSCGVKRRLRQRAVACIRSWRASMKRTRTRNGGRGRVNGRRYTVGRRPICGTGGKRGAPQRSGGRIREEGYAEYTRPSEIVMEGMSGQPARAPNINCEGGELNRVRSFPLASLLCVRWPLPSYATSSPAAKNALRAALSSRSSGP